MGVSEVRDAIKREVASWRLRVMALGMNQKTFALYIESPQPALSNWFNGKTEPAASTYLFVKGEIEKLEAMPKDKLQRLISKLKLGQDKLRIAG